MMKYTGYDYALSLLSYNPKTVAMMKRTLLSKGYDMDETQKTIEKLIEQDYLNDESFCKAYIQSEVINKGKSLAAIQAKLYEKGVPKDIIQQTIGELDKDLEESRHSNLIIDIKKLHKAGHDIIKIYEKLTRKGHHYEDIKQALQSLHEANSDD